MSTGPPVLLTVAKPHGVASVLFSVADGVVSHASLSQAKMIPPGDVIAVKPLSLVGTLISHLVCTMLARKRVVPQSTVDQVESNYDAALEAIWALQNYWEHVSVLANWFQRHKAARWLQNFKDARQADGTVFPDAASYWTQREALSGGHDFGGVDRVCMRGVFYTNGGKCPKSRSQLLALLEELEQNLEEPQAKDAFTKLFTCARPKFVHVGTVILDFEDFAYLAYDTVARWKVNAKMARFGIDHLGNFPLDTTQGHFWFRFGASFLGHLLVRNEYGRPYLSDQWLELHMLNPRVRTVLNVADVSQVKSTRTRLTEHLNFVGGAHGVGVQLHQNATVDGHTYCFRKQYMAANLEDVLRMSAVVEDLVNQLSIFIGIGSLSIAPTDGVDFGTDGAIGPDHVQASIERKIAQFVEADTLAKWWPPASGPFVTHALASPCNSFRHAYLSWLDFYTLYQAALLCQTLRDDGQYALLGQYASAVREFYYLTSVAVTKFPATIRCVEGVQSGNDIEFKVRGTSCGTLVRALDLRNHYFAHPTQKLFQNYGRNNGIIVWKSHQPPNRPPEPIAELDCLDTCSSDHFFSSSEIANWVAIAENVIRELFSQFSGSPGPEASALLFSPLPQVVCVDLFFPDFVNLLPGSSVYLLGDHLLLGSDVHLYSRLIVEKGKARIAFPRDVTVKFRFACFDFINHPGRCKWQQEGKFAKTFTATIKEQFVSGLFPKLYLQVSFSQAPGTWVPFP